MQINLQLQESNLPKAAAALGEETGVIMNTVDSVETFITEITNGHWDAVLQVRCAAAAATVTCPLLVPAQWTCQGAL